MDAPSFKQHDHTSCISDAIEAAEASCLAAGLRLTPQRKRVLEILLAEHRAVGAYEILEILKAEGQNAQPPVAYRALDFLVQNGFAHKVERLNAFIACTHPGQSHAPAFLICRSCQRVAETPSDPAVSQLSDNAKSTGFQVETTVIEALGICPDCNGTAEELSQ